ncbi:MAG: hypothetical protein MJ164_00050 [Alphaproteobacteria bacterium]|nr:hypothetical protein [Alphaproteobacteria bacterium]
MNKTKNKNLQKIKLENFLMVSTGTVAGFTLAFIMSWTVPVVCLFSVKKNGSKSDNTKYLEEYFKVYNDYIYELSQIPGITYSECKQRAQQRLQEYKVKQK